MFSIFLSYTKIVGVLKGCIFGPKFINVCINVCDSDCNSSCVLLADDFKFFHICYVEDCKLLQFDFDAVHKWFSDNDGKLNVDKTACIFLLSKQTVYNFAYKFDCAHIACSMCVYV